MPGAILAVPLPGLDGPPAARRGSSPAPGLGGRAAGAGDLDVDPGVRPARRLAGQPGLVARDDAPARPLLPAQHRPAGVPARHPHLLLGPDLCVQPPLAQRLGLDRDHGARRSLLAAALVGLVWRFWRTPGATGSRSISCFSSSRCRCSGCCRHRRTTASACFSRRSSSSPRWPAGGRSGWPTSWRGRPRPARDRAAGGPGPGRARPRPPGSSSRSTRSSCRITTS